jgi:hypothetical protein
MDQLDGNIQNVNELIQDPELNAMNLDIFLTKTRLNSFDKKYSYTKSSVI